MSVKTNLPIIALRGMTILPYMVIHFDISRKKSIKSVELAMKNGQKIFLVAQKSPDIINPKRSDVYDVGTICEIKQLVKMPGGLVRVLVRGLEKAIFDDFTEEEDVLLGDVVPVESEENLLPSAEQAARVRLLKEMMQRYYNETGRNQGDNISRIRAINGLDEIIYTSLADCTTNYIHRQEILEMELIDERFDTVCDIIADEIEVLEVKKQLADNVRSRVDKNQKDYVLREQIKAIKEQLGEGDSEDEAYKLREKVDKLNAPEYIKDRLNREISRYDAMSSSSTEANVIRSYIDTLLALPWSECSEDNYDVNAVQETLDEDHFGLKKVKERIIEFIAVKALKPDGDSPIICLVGPPGTGKTSIATSIARAVNKKYVRVCLGGVRDESEIRGHRKTYVGAMPGRIVAGLKQAKTANPLMLLDEIDKVGTDSRGDTASALLEVLDSEQNKAFVDHYIEEPIDLSNVFFLATANDASTIPRPLLDRMEIIEINSYTAVEKFHIAKDYLVSKQAKKNGLTKKQVSFSDDAIKNIIEKYTREAGVRELERKIASACRKAATMIVSGEKKTHRVTVKNLTDYLGPVKYLPEGKNKKSQIGVVKGLAWTSVGGTTLDVEAVTMPGKGGIVLTGKLGDVMKESAQVAIGYIRAVSDKYKIDADYFEKHDIHLHVPEGAVPKDGPSAGITITLAILSAITGRKIDCDVAMTGEMTLHGNVLPIGGLKEKLLAANKVGIKKVLIPAKNEKDLLEIEDEITEGMDVTSVKTMSDVIKEAME